MRKLSRDRDYLQSTDFVCNCGEVRAFTTAGDLEKSSEIFASMHDLCPILLH